MKTALTPERLGRYELLSRLATGGMAEVFLARATGEAGFEKAVAVKRMLPEVARDDEYVQMFLDEARLGAQLHHPNLADVYDFGQADGHYFIVMEPVHGKNLRDVLRTARGRGLPFEVAVAIACGIAAGLHHAHERRGVDGQPLVVVHRDVSPQNVIVTFDGGVKVVDFGVASARCARTPDRDGWLVGKIAYMSPEQCRGEALDRRSDLFSLGLLLWEMCTGSSPYRNANPHALLKEIAAGEPARASTRRGDLPAGLDAILARALHLDRAARYQNAQALQLDLEQFAMRAGLAASPIVLERYLRRLFPDSPTAPALRGVVPTGPITVDLPPARWRWRAGHALGVAAFSVLLGVALTVAGTERGEALPGAAELEPAPEPPSAAPSSSPIRSIDEPARSLLARWVAAQNSGDFVSYAALYAPDFRGVKRTARGHIATFDREGWLADRARLFPATIEVAADEPAILEADGEVELRFLQRWRSAGYADHGMKRLTLRREGGAFSIVSEELLASRAGWGTTQD